MVKEHGSSNAWNKKLTRHSWTQHIHKHSHKIVKDCNVLSKEPINPPRIPP